MSLVASTTILAKDTFGRLSIRTNSLWKIALNEQFTSTYSMFLGERYLQQSSHTLFSLVWLSNGMIRGNISHTVVLSDGHKRERWWGQCLQCMDKICGHWVATWTKKPLSARSLRNVEETRHSTTSERLSFFKICRHQIWGIMRSSGMWPSRKTR